MAITFTSSLAYALTAEDNAVWVKKLENLYEQGNWTDAEVGRMWKKEKGFVSARRADVNKKREVVSKGTAKDPFTRITVNVWGFSRRPEQMSLI